MKPRNLISSFKAAFQGLGYAARTQRNFRIHAAIAVFIIGLAALLKLTVFEWLMLFIIISLVIAVELINTSIEIVVDRLSQDHHDTARVIKDLAAGAVLICCVFAAAAGCLIFIPHIVAW